MSLELRITGPGGLGCTVTAGAGSTVGDVKALLESQLGIPASEQSLLFRGSQMSDTDGLAARAGRSASSDGSPLDLVLARHTHEDDLAEWTQRIAEPHGPGHRCLREAPEWVRASREVILAAIERNGCALEFASAELRADQALALVATAQSAQAFRYVAQELRADRDFISEVLRQNGLALGCLNSELRADRNVVLLAVQEDGAAFQYAAEALKAEPEFVLEAARWGEAALQYAREVLWGDASFVLAAAELSATAFDLSAAGLWHDRDFVLAAVKRQACALDFAVEELIEDADFILDAVDCNPKALEFVPAPSRPAAASVGGPKIRVEVVDVAALVSRLLQHSPSQEQAYRIARVVDDNTFEIAPSKRPATSPDEFWPNDCKLTKARRAEFFWKCLRGHLCLPATACLAAALRALCESGLQLAHEGAVVENILVMHAGMVDVADLLPSQISLLLPQVGMSFLIPATQSITARQGAAESGGGDAPEGRQGPQGDAFVGATAPHWWLAVVVREGPKAAPQMVHLDLCGPALDLFDSRPPLGDSEGPPPPVHIFRTPAYPHRLSMAREGRRSFTCHAGKLAVPQGVRHVQCLRGEGSPDGELTALPLDEFLQQQAELLTAVAARGVATKVSNAFIQRLDSGVGVRVSGAKAPPSLRGKVGRLLDCQGTDGPSGRLRVRIGHEDVMLAPDALKIFPACSLPQFRSLEDMAKDVEDIEVMFPPCSHVTIVNQQDFPQLGGKHAEVLQYNGASGRFQVRLMDDSGDLKAIWPWDLDAHYLDDEVVREFFRSEEPAATVVAAQLSQESNFPFTLFEDPAVAKLVKRLLDAGFWLGFHAQEELLSNLCRLAEHPHAARAIQIMREREEAKELPGLEAAAKRKQLDAEVGASPGLQQVFERHEAVRIGGKTARWVFHGPRHQGPVRFDPYEFRQKVGLEV